MFETRPELDEITYLDADLLFFSDPEPLFEEMGDGSVLIIPHRFSPGVRRAGGQRHLQRAVPDLPPRPRGDAALHWWHDRCIEWCYYRLEDGKLGDQKYLDDWPERFEGVHVLQHKGGGLAPWNALAVPGRGAGWRRVFVDEVPLVFFHYHRVSMRLSGRHDWRPPGTTSPAPLGAWSSAPICRRSSEALAEIRAVDPGFERGLEETPPLHERINVARSRFGQGGAPALAGARVRALSVPDARPRSRPTLLIRLEVPFVDLRREGEAIRAELDAAIGRVLDSGRFLLGEEGRAFEEEFAAAMGAEHAVGVASGTDAVELALRAVGIGPGDEVITQANTCVPTVTGIVAGGGTPVLCDVDPSSAVMDARLARGRDRRADARGRARAPLRPVRRYGGDRRAVRAARHRGGRGLRAGPWGRAARPPSRDPSAPRAPSASIRPRTWARWATAGRSSPATRTRGASAPPPPLRPNGPVPP